MSQALIGNPFFVLGLAVTASAREIEREAQRLLGMLELGLDAAATYLTPLGPQPRTAEAVRAAAATLRDPRRRLLAELWASGGVDHDGADRGVADRPAAATPAGWPDAMTATGWGRR